MTAVHDRMVVELADVESEPEGGPTGFGGVAVTPGEPREPPADLDRRRERGLEVGGRQTR